MTQKFPAFNFLLKARSIYKEFEYFIQKVGGTPLDLVLKFSEYGCKSREQALYT